MSMSGVRITRLSGLMGYGAILALSGAAYAQQDLKAVDPNVGDRGPLATSFREASLDLRQPTNFDRVYRVPGNEERFMRASGALYAVFPRSIYVQTRSGSIATIPDGTVFYIGAPSFLNASPSERAPSRALAMRQENLYRVENRIDSTADSLDPARGRRLHPVPGRAHRFSNQERVASQPTIINDPGYRAARLRGLMKQAARTSGS